MKPLKSELQDTETLRQLGSASVQIVHDLKNQLNGLKLYATFLKKRMEKGERPADEQETIGKIIAGLERAATDMTVLVRYGRPLDVRPQPRTDLARLLAEAAGDPARLSAQGDAYEGDFDPPLLGEALQTITNSVAPVNDQPDGDGATDSPRIRLRRDDTGAAARGHRMGRRRPERRPRRCLQHVRRRAGPPARARRAHHPLPRRRSLAGVGRPARPSTTSTKKD